MSGSNAKTRERRARHRDGKGEVPVMSVSVDLSLSHPPHSTPCQAVRLRIGDQSDASWLLKPGGGCVLSKLRGRLLVVREPRPEHASCRLFNTGSALLVEKQDEAATLSVGVARVDRAELPLEGRFRLDDEVVSFTRVLNEQNSELLPGLVGRAPAMQQLAKLAARVAQFEVPALVLGESGTGKELVARALHQLGPRHAQPFVVVNAAELSPQLGGSALFGHVRGAYTGADRARQGAFRRAHGGTLFLDEVAELGAELQAQLLRVVEQGCVAAVGDDATQPVDVRLVAATCKPLSELVLQGRFRHDLYQRLAVHTLRLPPLRQRRSDIALIARRLLRQPQWLGFQLAEDALEPLQHQPLAGNVRELRNLLAQAALFADDAQVIDAAAIQRAVEEAASAGGRRPTANFVQLLERCGGNVSVAARAAGLPRSTFRDRLKKSRKRPGAHVRFVA